MYTCTHYDIMQVISWHMNAQQLIPAVIVVYINMHGDTYLVMSVHIDMPGDNPPEKVNCKLHTAGIKEIHGYIQKWLQGNELSVGI